MMTGRVKGGRRKRNIYSGMDRDSEKDSASDQSDEGMDEDFQAREEPGSSRASPLIIHDEEPAATVPEAKLLPDSTRDFVGGALRRNEDGTIQEPKLVKRRPKGSRVSNYTLLIRLMSNFYLNCILY